MFSKSAGRSYAPPILLLAVLLTSCSRQPAVPAVERVAILRFENLSGDTSLNWMGRALSEIVASEVYPAGKMRVILAPTLHGLDRVLGVSGCRRTPDLPAPSNLIEDDVESA